MSPVAGSPEVEAACQRSAVAESKEEIDYKAFEEFRRHRLNEVEELTLHSLAVATEPEIERLIGRNFGAASKFGLRSVELT